MNRFLKKELSPERIYHAVMRRIKNIPDTIAWHYPSNTRHQNQSRLIQFARKHVGNRCFIIGNGPSIAKMDLSPLKNEFTFGLNRIYLAFEKLPSLPSYYVCVNELVLEQFSSEIGKLPMPKFLNWNRRAFFDASDKNTNFIKLSMSLKDRFNKDICFPFYSGGTVTFVAIQLAFIMGFSEIILIGVDHSFVDKGAPNKIELRDVAVDANHFHPNYFPKGVKWQLPDLLRSELAYNIARWEVEKHGGRILDATQNGKLEVFEKVAFTDLF